MLENYFHHELHHTRAAELRAVAERHRIAKQVSAHTPTRASRAARIIQHLGRWWLNRARPRAWRTQP